MNLPADLLYTKSHLWVKSLEDGSYELGITDHAQKELSSVVFVNLPEEDDSAELGKVIADIESIKAVSDIISPFSGNIAAINERLADEPGLVNSNPYETWLFKVSDITEKEEFLSPQQYSDFLE